MQRRSSEVLSAEGADRTAHEDMEACRELLRHGSKSFAAAALLLPKRVRDPATALYAFCRVADDAIDEAGGGAGALGGLRERLARAYAGTPADGPVDRALSRVARAHAMPRELMEALLDGFAWDAEGRRYESLSALQAYGARVAGTVGAMMTVLMGPRDAEVLARACDLGVAMQLTNIARDVGQDARAGRLYLPLDWLREAGIDADTFLARPAHSEALAGVVERLLRRADELYARSDEGIAMLPPDCRASIRAARLIYAEIGRAIERAGFDSVSRRAVVPGRRKVWLLLRSFLRSNAEKAYEGARRGLPPLEETRFLVEAAALGEAAKGTGRGGAVTS